MRTTSLVQALRPLPGDRPCIYGKARATGATAACCKEQCSGFRGVIADSGRRFAPDSDRANRYTEDGSCSVRLNMIERDLGHIPDFFRRDLEMVLDLSDLTRLERKRRPEEDLEGFRLVRF